MIGLTVLLIIIGLVLTGIAVITIACRIISDIAERAN
jgi:hypothetical protein